MTEGTRYYTLAEWNVRRGEEEAFINAWEALGQVFRDLPGAPAIEGTLLRSLQDPQRFYSFGPWKNLEAIQAMRADPRAQEAIDAVRAHCVSASPGAYEEVRRIKTG